MRLHVGKVRLRSDSEYFFFQRSIRCLQRLFLTHHVVGSFAIRDKKLQVQRRANERSNGKRITVR